MTVVNRAISPTTPKTGVRGKVVGEMAMLRQLGFLRIFRACVFEGLPVKELF